MVITQTPEPPDEPTSKRILNRRNLSKVGRDIQLLLPLNRNQKKDHPDRLCVMTQRNFNVYSYIGLYTYTDRRFLTIIYTGAGPDFIRKSNLPSGYYVLVKDGFMPSICYENNWPLDLKGNIRLSTKIRGKRRIIRL